MMFQKLFSRIPYHPFCVGSATGARFRAYSPKLSLGAPASPCCGDVSELF